MQPYFFPYIGYFQLINAVDKFVFYDDVHFITGGWINRNRVLINGSEALISLSLAHQSPKKLINQVFIHEKNERFLKTIKNSYSRAPYFKEVYPIVEIVLAQISESQTIARLAEISVRTISDYLGISTIMETSSNTYGSTVNLGREERLHHICLLNKAEIVIYPEGAKQIYSKKSYNKFGMQLFFIKNHFIPYKQFGNKFIGGLSIIDVLMFNGKTKTRDMINDYELE